MRGYAWDFVSASSTCCFAGRLCQVGYDVCLNAVNGSGDSCGRAASRLPSDRLTKHHPQSSRCCGCVRKGSVAVNPACKSGYLVRCGKLCVPQSKGLAFVVHVVSLHRCGWVWVMLFVTVSVDISQEWRCGTSRRLTPWSFRSLKVFRELPPRGLLCRAWRQ